MAAKDSKKPKSKEDQGKIIMHKKTHDIQNAIFGEAINNPANASITKPGSSMRNPKIKPRAESFATSLPTTIGKASRLDEGRSKSNNKAGKKLDSKSRSLTEKNVTEVQLNGGSTTKVIRLLRFYTCICEDYSCKTYTSIIYSKPRLSLFLF